VVIRYMLDTNTCIALIKDQPEGIRVKMSDFSREQVGISSIVAAELWYGVALSEKKRQNEAALKDFINFVIVLSWPDEAGPTYGNLRASLRKKGTPIGAMDLLIASHALCLNVTLVTDNIKEFQRVQGLKIENWLENKTLSGRDRSAPSSRPN
jgi:tRNA(fMet)-specific endonuclease VapC